MNELGVSFDRLAVINLDRRTGRWESFLQSLRRIRWPFKDPVRVAAIDSDATGVPIWWLLRP